MLISTRFDEEKWYAKYMLGKMNVNLKTAWPGVQNVLLEAFAERPQRIEPIYEIVRHYRDVRDYQSAFLFAAIWQNFPYPAADRLFIERDIYDYLMPYEFILSAAMTDRLDLAEKWMSDIWQGTVPDWMRPWVLYLRSILKDQTMTKTQS